MNIGFSGTRHGKNRLNRAQEHERMKKAGVAEMSRNNSCNPACVGQSEEIRAPGNSLVVLPRILSCQTIFGARGVCDVDVNCGSWKDWGKMPRVRGVPIRRLHRWDIISHAPAGRKRDRAEHARDLSSDPVGWQGMLVVIDPPGVTRD